MRTIERRMHADSTSTTETDSFRREQGHAVLSMANGEDAYAVSSFVWLR